MTVSSECASFNRAVTALVYSRIPNLLKPMLFCKFRREIQSGTLRYSRCSTGWSRIARPSLTVLRDDAEERLDDVPMSPEGF